MFKHIKRTLIVTAAVAALTAPSTAIAQPADYHPGQSASGGQSQPVTSTSDGLQTRSAASGFDWGDAGIGAASMLGLLGAGVASVGTRRRRTQRTTVA